MSPLPSSLIAPQPKSEEASDKTEVLEIGEDANLGANPSNEQDLDVEGSKANEEQRPEHSFAGMIFQGEELEKAACARAQRGGPTGRQVRGGQTRPPSKSNSSGTSSRVCIQRVCCSWR